MVAGEMSAYKTTHMTNASAQQSPIKHLHLMVQVLIGINMSARSKFAHESNVACDGYH